MVPLIELRGAIPIAIGMGLQTIPAIIVCVIGNILPVPIIYFFARKVLLWGRDKKYIGKFFTFCIEKGEKGGQKLKARAGRGGLFIALLLFVGIPLPGTGAWTGTLAASFLNKIPDGSALKRFPEKLSVWRLFYWIAASIRKPFLPICIWMISASSNSRLMYMST